MTVIALGAAASATDIHTDLNVASHHQMSDDTLDVRANITVGTGGWLDLTDVDIVMNATIDGQYTIKVESGGKLTMVGGSMAALNSSYRYKVELHDETVLEGVTVSDTWGQGQAFNASHGTEPTLANLKGGLQVYSDDVYIGNCTLSHGLLCMVYAKDSTPTLYGNAINNVTYDVRHYFQNTSDPSTTEWSAMAFGVLLDNSAASLKENDFADIGVFSTMASVLYHASSNNTNDYHVIAGAVALRNTHIDMENNTITKTGTLERTSWSRKYMGNNVDQTFSIYRAAGILGYMVSGANMKYNHISRSHNGIYATLPTSAVGGPMTFDIIVENVFTRNDMTGARFNLYSVDRDVTFNIVQDRFNDNGRAPTSGLDDCGLAISAVSCTGDLTVDLKGTVMSNNRARGVYIDVHQHSGKLVVRSTDSNSLANNRGAGLLVSVDTVTDDVRLLVENTTCIRNSPQITNDPGAIALVGNALSAALNVKMADVTSSNNTGTGAGIDLGASSANRATSTRYRLHNCQFSSNSAYGLFLYDNYGINRQTSEYEWKRVHANENRWAVYVHSISQMGNIDLQVDGLTATDTTATDFAVTLQMAAPTYNPRTQLRNVRITWTGGPAPGSDGLSLVGVSDAQRWNLDLLDAFIAEPNIALDAQYCEVQARRCNLTGAGLNSIRARESNVHLKYCQVPDLSATVQGSSVNMGVYYYRFLNISKVAWQNEVPIRNTSITIKRHLDPRNQIYTGTTDATGKLPFKMVKYWEKDRDNIGLWNNELQAFAVVNKETIQSLWFDFNATAIGIDDPHVPDIIINTPAKDTVQKAGTLIIQGELRDTHSGIRALEVTLDNVVWTRANIASSKWGRTRVSFEIILSNLTDDVYVITVRGWDVARFHDENLSFAEEIIPNVRIDSTPPALEMTNPEEDYTVTNQRTYILQGRTESSGNIRRLTINDSRVLVGQNAFSKEVYLHEGSNFFIIIAEDKAGNIAVVTREIILDTRSPALIVTSPVKGFSSKQPQFEVAGDTEETAEVYVQLDDRSPQPVVDRGGPRFYFVQNIKREGHHKLTIIAEDEAGNVAREEVWVKYDTTPPVLEDIIPPFDPKPTNQQRVYVAGHTDTEVKQVVVNGLIFPVSHGDFALEINLLEGEQVLTIQVTDPAGNSNSTTRQVLVDVTPPLLQDLTISSSKPGGPSWDMESGLMINERSVRFRGRLAEEDFRELWVQVGTDNRTAIIDDPDARTFYRDFNLDEGNNIVSFFATDIAGNRLKLVYTINVDPRVPKLTYHHPKMNNAMEAKVGEASIVVSGRVTDVGSVTMMINNRQVVVRPDTGAFQVTVPLEEGLNNIEVEATDRAGNTATDLLHITYEKEGAGATSVGEALANLWWVFAILIGLVILVPIVVNRTRTKWEQEHPELKGYDPQMDREGLYEYEDYQYEDDYRRGGGYR